MLYLGHLLRCAGRNEERLEISEAAITENEASGARPPTRRRDESEQREPSTVCSAAGDEAIAQTDIVFAAPSSLPAGLDGLPPSRSTATAPWWRTIWHAPLMSWAEVDGQGRGEPTEVAYRWLVLRRERRMGRALRRGLAAIAVAGLVGWQTGTMPSSTGSGMQPSGSGSRPSDRCISALVRSRACTAKPSGRAAEGGTCQVGRAGDGWALARSMPAVRQAPRRVSSSWSKLIRPLPPTSGRAYVIAGVLSRAAAVSRGVREPAWLPKRSWRPATGAPQHVSCPPAAAWRDSLEPRPWGALIADVARQRRNSRPFPSQARRH